MSELFEMMKNMTRAYASTITKNTGCSECDELPGNELCLDCQLEQAEWDVMKAMDNVEKIKERSGARVPLEGE